MRDPCYYLKGFAPMLPAPCFLMEWWLRRYEAKWLRKSGSLAWLGAWETLTRAAPGEGNMTPSGARGETPEGDA